MLAVEPSGLKAKKGLEAQASPPMASVVRATNAIRAGRIRPEVDGYACMGVGQRWRTGERRTALQAFEQLKRVECQ
jgi:hypothetical protein